MSGGEVRVGQGQQVWSVDLPGTQTHEGSPNETRVRVSACQRVPSRIRQTYVWGVCGGAWAVSYLGGRRPLAVPQPRLALVLAAVEAVELVAFTSSRDPW